MSSAGLRLALARASALLFLMVIAFQISPSFLAESIAAPVRTSAYRQYKIGAYYFGYWGPHFPQDQLRHYEQVYHHTADPWAGVRDLHEPETTGTPLLYRGDFHHLKPQIGYYDLSHVDVIEQHIRQAANAGLSYFNFYFYWDPAANAEKYGDGLQSFLVASNRNDIEFMLSVVSGRTGTQIPVQDFDRVASHIVDTYIAQKDYLRTPDGRPMIEILNNQGLGDGSATQTDEFIGRIRDVARRKLGVDIFVLSSTNEPGYQTWRTANGVTCSDHFLYPEGPSILQKSYEDYIANIDGYFSLIKKYVPNNDALLYCVSSGHDERPRLYLNTAAISSESVERIRRMLPFYTDRSPQLFRDALRKTKALMDNSTSPLKNYLNIYAWNEWNEGGIIEPNEKDGDAYLAAIREIFALPRNLCGLTQIK